MAAGFVTGLKVDDYTVHIGLLTLDLFIPASESLKAKRRSLQSFKEKVRGRHNVSIAEVGELDKWQRAVLAVTAVSNDRNHLNTTFSEIVAFAETLPEAQLLDSRLEFI